MKHGFSKLFTLTLIVSALVIGSSCLAQTDDFVTIQGGQMTQSGTGQPAKLETTSTGSGTAKKHTLKTSGGGAGAGGDASAANQTAVQANAGSDASKAAAVQGITGGKPLAVKIDHTTPGTTDSVTVAGAQYTIAITPATTGATIPAGKHHIEFILSSDFAGTIAGAAIDPAIIGVYDPGTLPVGSTFAALVYTISAGSATITTW